MNATFWEIVNCFTAVGGLWLLISQPDKDETPGFFRRLFGLELLLNSLIMCKLNGVWPL